MSTVVCSRAIEDALESRCALLKFVSPNDLGLTGGHQKGFYLPNSIHNIFTPFAPERGINSDYPVEILWDDGTVTQSMVKWYGVAKSEYRLTSFNRIRGFPYLAQDKVGALLVLVPKGMGVIHSYMLSNDEDFEDLQASLGVEVVDRWVLFGSDDANPRLAEGECLDQRYSKFVSNLEKFPTTYVFSEEAQHALVECSRGFLDKVIDEQLIKLVRTEYELFKRVESALCIEQISQQFSAIDQFLEVAQSILQRRKSRAGKSLENHVEYLLRESSLPFERQTNVDGTRPDILIPGKSCYEDPSWPIEKLYVLGIKTTCKDRWRQVTQEAPRIPKKYILTLQNGVTATQLEQMDRLNVSLVVPKDLHSYYPSGSENQVLTVAAFVDKIKQSFAEAS